MRQVKEKINKINYKEIRSRSSKWKSINNLFVVNKQQQCVFVMENSYLRIQNRKNKKEILHNY